MKNPVRKHSRACVAIARKLNISRVEVSKKMYSIFGLHGISGNVKHLRDTHINGFGKLVLDERGKQIKEQNVQSRSMTYLNNINIGNT